MIIISFTHDTEINFMLPGIPPAGKYVILPHVVVMILEGNKTAHEHIYWDRVTSSSNRSSGYSESTNFLVKASRKTDEFNYKKKIR
jgi:hypothetical protein